MKRGTRFGWEKNVAILKQNEFCTVRTKLNTPYIWRVSGPFEHKESSKELEKRHRERGEQRNTELLAFLRERPANREEEKGTGEGCE